MLYEGSGGVLQRERVWGSEKNFKTVSKDDDDEMEKPLSVIRRPSSVASGECKKSKLKKTSDGSKCRITKFIKG